MFSLRHFPAALCVVLAAGCASAPVPNANGVATKAIDPTVAGPASGLGIESQDIVAMTDQMMRDMLSNASLVRTAAGKAPRVIIDSEYFRNESTQPINRRLITDRLRVSLNRSAQGRMVFVGRHVADMVEQERQLKRSGTTDVGTTGLASATLGGDFRLSGNIASQDHKSTKSGMMQRYTQISFEMTDLESGEIVWGGLYEFARSAADDVVYR